MPGTHVRYRRGRSGRPVGSIHRAPLGESPSDRRLRARRPTCQLRVLLGAPGAEGQALGLSQAGRRRFESGRPWSRAITIVDGRRSLQRDRRFGVGYGSGYCCGYGWRFQYGGEPGVERLALRQREASHDGVQVDLPILFGIFVPRERIRVASAGAARRTRGAAARAWNTASSTMVINVGPRRRRLTTWQTGSATTP
jgi:hypothetical protein